MATEPQFGHVDVNLISSPVGSKRDEERARRFVTKFLTSKGWEQKRTSKGSEVLVFDRTGRKSRTTR